MIGSEAGADINCFDTKGEPQPHIHLKARVQSPLL